jgi:hypothetical protein
VWRLQNLNEQEQIRKFCCGLVGQLQTRLDKALTSYIQYTYMQTNSFVSKYWKRTLEMDACGPASHDTEFELASDDSESKLYFPTISEALMKEEETVSTRPAPVWCSAIRYVPSESNTFVSFLQLGPPDEQGAVIGTGFESSQGRFHITGVITGNQLSILCKYWRDEHSERFEGQFSDDQEECRGTWQIDTNVSEAPDDEDQVSPTSHECKDMQVNPPNNPSLVYYYQRRPAEWWMCRPPTSQFQANRIKALWTYALNAVMHRIRLRHGHIRTTELKKHGEKRRRYMNIQSWHGSFGQYGPALNDEQWDNLAESVHFEDQALWSAIREFLERRQLRPYP